MIRFFKKTVASKLLNGTTGTVGDIQRHHAEQCINLQYFPVVVHFRITNFFVCFLLFPEMWQVFGWKTLGSCLCNGCMPVRAVCKPRSPDLKRGALATDVRGCSLWGSLLERPPPAPESRERRVRDLLGELVRTRVGGVTLVPWPGREWGLVIEWGRLRFRGWVRNPPRRVRDLLGELVRTRVGGVTLVPWPGREWGLGGWV